MVDDMARDSKHDKEVDALGRLMLAGGAGAGKVNVQDLTFTKMG